MEEEGVNEAADSGLVGSTDRVSLSEREGATEKEEDPNKEEWKETWEGDEQEVRKVATPTYHTSSWILHMDEVMAGALEMCPVDCIL